MSTPTGPHFSPNGGVEAATVAVIQAAVATIDIGVYAINDNPITAAIIAAFNRGVTVRLLIDGHLEQSANVQVLRMFNAHVPIRCAFQYTSYHNKFAIADVTTVLTGSANFTYQADTKNAENIVVINDAGIASAFTTRFDSDWNGAQPYTPPRPMA
jgi:phosphatidylserine/phosphatidylglycerophosphate/cardiolipin synthase-like enzyme